VTLVTELECKRKELILQQGALQKQALQLQATATQPITMLLVLHQRNVRQLGAKNSGKVFRGGCIWRQFYLFRKLKSATWHCNISLSRLSLLGLFEDPFPPGDQDWAGGGRSRGISGRLSRGISGRLSRGISGRLSNRGRSRSWGSTGRQGHAGSHNHGRQNEQLLFHLFFLLKILG
jgi:hypothetical protein